MRGIRLLEEDKGFMSHFMLPVTFFGIYAAVIFPPVLKGGFNRVEAGVMSSTEAWLLAIAVSTFPVWAAALYGAVAALFTWKDSLSGAYATEVFNCAFDAFILILVGVYVLGILGLVTVWVVSLF